MGWKNKGSIESSILNLDKKDEMDVLKDLWSRIKFIADDAKNIKLKIEISTK